MHPGFHNLPFDLIERCDGDHCVGQSNMRPRHLTRRIGIMQPKTPRNGRQAVSQRKKPCVAWRIMSSISAGDWLLAMTLLLATATAIATMPRSATEFLEKVQVVLINDDVPELLATAGAIGAHFPVSP
jgi:hypothetical protein